MSQQEFSFHWTLSANCLNVWAGIATSSGKVWITSHKKTLSQTRSEVAFICLYEIPCNETPPNYFLNLFSKISWDFACYPHPHPHRPFLRETWPANLFKTYNQTIPISIFLKSVQILDLGWMYCLAHGRLELNPQRHKEKEQECGERKS